MEENLKKQIVKLTNCPLFVDWLQLSGFESVDDVVKITEKVINDIENYISNLFGLMSQEEREKYVHHELFQEHPSRFKFPPCWKLRLLQAIDSIKNELNPVTAITTKVPFDNCKPCSPTLHESVVNSIKKKHGVIQNKHILDFTLFQSQFEQNNVPTFGYFACSIVEQGVSCGRSEKFFFKTPQSINLDPIYNHMKTHFTPSNRITRRSSIGSTGELADARLCDDISHNEIIKAAALKFVNCRLLRDIDFNMFEIVNGDGSLTNHGCFTCYLCAKSKNIESKIKFFYTSHRSVIASNILAHLRRHFQSVAPSVLSPTESQKSTKKPRLTISKRSGRQSYLVGKSGEVKLEVLSNKENIA